MNTLADKHIREALHCKKLRRQHDAPNTLVVDELGLMHGKHRVDIAVINGHIVGYEIKSDEDTLYRLPEQITAYNKVFDRVTIVVGVKHADEVYKLVPDWWGITVAQRGERGAINFECKRPANFNLNLDHFSIAQLLWKNEVISILSEFEIPANTLTQRRSELYRLLVELMKPSDLHRRVRDCLKTRKNWRCHPQPSQYDDSYQPVAI